MQIYFCISDWSSDIATKYPDSLGLVWQKIQDFCLVFTGTFMYIFKHWFSMTWIIKTGSLRDNVNK